MKTTRILAIVIALSILAVLCACNGGGSGNVTTPADDKTSAATPESTGAPATDAPTAPVTDAPTQPATDAPATSAEPVETDAPIPEPAQVDGVYQIASADDLLWVSTKGPLDGKYLLTADIEFNLTEGYEKWTIENTPKNTMTPIGNSVVPFSGTFDGGGHLITGLCSYTAQVRPVCSASSTALRSRTLSSAKALSAPPTRTSARSSADLTAKTTSSATASTTPT